MRTKEAEHTSEEKGLLAEKRRDEKAKMTKSPSTEVAGSEKNGERDPEVVESMEDSRTTRRLQQQREEKRLERERRARTQTEATRHIEAAIEAVENTMEDSVRLGQLKEKSDQLSYATRPKLNEANVVLGESGGRALRRSLSARQTRSRSSSLSRTVVDKYAHVKPKTLTRVSVQTARTDADNSKLNAARILNDSGSLRENVYNEWYYFGIF